MAQAESSNVGGATAAATSDKGAPSDETPAAGTSQRRRNPVWAWIWLGSVAVLVVVAVLVGVEKITERGSLPRCDSQRARDTLSNVFKQHQVSPSRYDERRTVSSTDAEVTCVARLTMPDSSRIEVDYRFYREGNEQKVGYAIRKMP